MTAPPIPFRWDGEAMVPTRGFARRADEAFVVGEVYALVEHLERSHASHAHEFAWIADAWASLPEALAAQHPSAEHLRKWALIRAGFCNVRDVACGSHAEALRTAALVQGLVDYSIAVAERSVCRIYTAESQSMRAMGRERFQASKDGIIRVISELLEVAPEVLRSQGGAAAEQAPPRAA